MNNYLQSWIDHYERYIDAELRFCQILLEIESRARGRYKQNPETGRMEGSYPATGADKVLTKSATGGTIDLSKRKEGYNEDSTGRFYIPFDSKDNPYRRPEYYLPPKEYKRVTSGISTYYSSQYSEKPLGEYITSKNKYKFENHGFSEYNIYEKKKHK